MKILVLTNLYPPHYVGGYELRCATITERLRAKGHEVRVLTSNHGLTPADLEKSSKEEDSESKERGISRALRVHGFFGHPWLGISKLRFLELYNNEVLQETLQRFKPEIVHVWNMGGISKSLLLTLQKSGIPVVYDVSDHWIARSLKWDVWLRWWNNRQDVSFVNKLGRQIAQLVGVRKWMQDQAPTNPVEHIKFQRIYFCSKRLKQITLEAGYPVSHGEVIYCPVNTDVFNGEPKTSDQPMHKLLYVGRLSEDKGVMTALRAMYELKDKFSGTLSVYGTGEPHYVEKLKHFVNEERLPVVFASVSNPKEMPEVYRNHDALLFTSEWEEPFALTPLEGMACGLPVIGTLTGGSAELFVDGENGLTYKAGEAEELAQQVLKLSSHAELRGKIAATGHKLAIERYNEPNIASQIEAYLHTTLNQWQPTPLPHYSQDPEFKIQ